MTPAHGLTRVELDPLLTLLRDARQDGDYYGPREQYWKRHDRIWRKLESAWKALTGESGYPLKSRALKYDAENGRR